MATRCEIRLDSFLDRCEPQLVEARALRLRPGLVAEVGERGATPECKRLVRLSFGQQVFEAGGIELVSLKPEEIAGRARLDPVHSESLPELRDVHLQRCLRSFRRPLAPESVDQPLTRDELVPMQEEEGE